MKDPSNPPHSPLSRRKTASHDETRRLALPPQRITPFLDAAGLAAFVVSPDGQIKEHNRKAAEFLGSLSGRVRGWRLWDMIPSRQRVSLRAKAAEVLEEKGEFRLTIAKGDGSHVFHLFHLPDSPGLLGCTVTHGTAGPATGIDTAETHRFLSSLSSAASLEEAFQLFLNQALEVSGMESGGIYVVDDVEGQMELVVHKGLSPKFLKQVSVVPRDAESFRMVMRGKPIYLSTEHSLSEMGKLTRQEGYRQRIMLPVRHGLQVLACLNLASRKEDALPPPESRADLESLAMVLVQPVLRWTVERRLKQSEEHYRSLVDNLNDVLYATDMIGRITFVSPAVEKLLPGLASSNMLGQSLFEFVHNEDGALVRSWFQGLLDRGGNDIIEYRMAGLRRGPVWVQSSSRCRVESGRVVGVQGLLRDVTEQKRAEANARDYHKRLVQLDSEMFLYEEKQRRALAEELHDGIGQTLATAKLKLGQLGKQSDEFGLKEPIEDVRATVGHAIAAIRGAVFDLATPILYQVGLIEAIEQLAARMLERYGLMVTVIAQNRLEWLIEDHRAIIYKAVRELLVNAYKHGGAMAVVVRAAEMDEGYAISVTDDGAGFDPSDTEFPSGKGGFGLFNIRVRLENLGGQVVIDKSRGRGGKISMILPLEMNSNLGVGGEA